MRDWREEDRKRGSLTDFIAHTRAAMRATMRRVMNAKGYRDEQCPVCRQGKIHVFYDKGEAA